MASSVFNLNGDSGITVSAYYQYSLEDDYDFVYLEYSTDAGVTCAFAATPSFCVRTLAMPAP